MAEKKKDEYQEVEAFGKIVAFVGILILALTMLLPTLLGVALYVVLYRNTRLRRGHYGSGLLAASVASFFTFTNGGVGRYFSWLAGIVGIGDVSFTQVPFFPLLSYSAFVGFLIGVIGIDWIMGHTPAKVAEALNLAGGKSAVNVDPDEAHRIAAIARPPESLTEDRSLFSGEHDPDGQRIMIGLDINKKPVHLHTHDLSMHGMVLGTTGSGKTVTLKALIEGMLDLGYSGCVLDLKEDIGEGGLADFLEAYAHAKGVPYQHWALSYRPEEYEFYLDPLTGLDQDLAQNMIVSMQDFEAPHWEMMCKQVLGQLLDLMYMAHEIAPEKHPAPNLRDVGRYLSGDIHDTTQSMRATVTMGLKGTGIRDENDYLTLSNPSPDHRTASKGLGARISAAYESQAGRTGLRPSAERRPLRLADPGIVYVGLDSLGKADTSRVVSSSILAGYSALASQRKDDPKVKAKQDRRFLVIDEANTVNTTMVMNLLSRARSAGITVILATQGAIDWGDDWNAMVNNTNFSIIMGQQDPESARRAAELIGYETRVDESQQLVGTEVVRTNLRQVDDYRVDPEQLRALERGQAYVRVRERYGSSKPYLTWAYIFFRKVDRTAPDFQTTAVRRSRPAGGAPFVKALPKFGAEEDLPRIAAPPVPRQNGPTPRQGGDGTPLPPPPGDGWNSI